MLASPMNMGVLANFEQETDLLGEKRVIDLPRFGAERSFFSSKSNRRKRTKHSGYRFYRFELNRLTGYFRQAEMILR